MPSARRLVPVRREGSCTAMRDGRHRRLHRLSHALRRVLPYDHLTGVGHRGLRARLIPGRVALFLNPKAHQARRKEQQQKEMYHAILFRQFKNMLQEPFSPAEFGFASSTAQIDQQILFRETLAKAQIAKEVGFNPEKFRIKLAQS